jgi:ClpP class serine protease
MYSKTIYEIFDGIWMIDRQKAEVYYPLVLSILKGEYKNSDNSQERSRSRAIQFAVYKNGIYQISEYGMALAPEDAPANSVAIINIIDVITKYDQYCGPVGMLSKADLLTRCYLNENIDSVILKVDSPGGEGRAAMFLQQTIRKRNKPVLGFAEDTAASAGYLILSPCDFIMANSELANIGSIGTFVTINDFTEAMKLEGIKQIEVYADASVDKNKDYYDALKGDLAGIKEKVNKFNDQFLADVKQNRAGKLGKDKEWNTGKLFFADEAEKIGLIDGVGTLEELVQSIHNYYK